MHAVGAAQIITHELPLKNLLTFVPWFQTQSVTAGPKTHAADSGSRLAFALPNRASLETVLLTSGPDFVIAVVPPETVREAHFK